MSTCLSVIAGRQPSSSFKIDKQMVPDGYTLGWKSGGTNLPETPQKIDQANNSEGRKEASMATVRKTNTRTNGGNTLDLDFVSTYISGASRDNPR